MEYETYADVIDAYNADNMGYSTLTDYIKGQNIKIKEISMEPLADLQKSLFENKADGGVIGIEVKIADEMAKGGRVGLVSGGALKGLASLFKAGKDKIADFAETQASKKIYDVENFKPTVYPKSGPMTIEALEAVDDDIVRRLLRTQELGLNKETPEILKAANLLARFTKKVKGKRVIDYERAEAILGVPLKGDETINDLFKIEFETRPVEKMADGGRVGLFMGGPALEGQALQIYNSMKGYNFSDQEIADALSARGLYTPAGSGTTTTAPEGIIGAQLNQGGGRDDNQTGFGKFGNLDPTTEKTFVKDVYSIDMAAPGAPMTGSFKPTKVTGYLNTKTGNYQTFEGKNINHAGINFKPAFVGILEALGLGEPKNLTGLPYKEGQIAGTFTGKKLSDFNPLNLFKKQQSTVAEINAMNQKAIKDMQAKKAAEEAAARRELENRIISGGANISGGGGGNITTSAGTFAPGDYSDVAGTLADPREKMDFYKDGGLATMFTRRR